jgi:hypothetical protein
MTVEQKPAAEQTLRLVYRPTRNEIADVMRTRRQVAPGARRRRVQRVVALLVLAAGVVLGAVHGEVLGTSVPLLALAAALWALSLLFKWLAARQVHRVKDGLGEHRVTVGPDGVRVKTDTTALTVPWSQLSGYAETEHLFLLVHQGMNNINTLPLPKRVLSEDEGTDRLRDLLDRHSVRKG